MKRQIIVLAAALIVLATTSALWAKSAKKSDPQQLIAWSVEEINESLALGEDKTITVTFKSRVNLPKTASWISSSIDNVVSVNPKVFPSISANKPYQLTVAFSAPENGWKKHFAGIIQLKDASKWGWNWNWMWSWWRSYPDSLKVEVEIAKRPPPIIGTPVATPAIIGVNAPTTVTVTSLITDSSVIPGSVALQRLDASSSNALGYLHDDGQNGDAVAGDKIFTIQQSFNEVETGQIQLQVSAAFRGVLARMYSAILVVDIWNYFTDADRRYSIKFPQNVQTLTYDDIFVMKLSMANPDQEEPSLSISIDPNPGNLTVFQYYNGESGRDLVGQSGDFATPIIIAEMPAFEFNPVTSFAGGVVIIVPRDGFFLRITDEGGAFQESAMLYPILTTLSF